jgi:tryptophan synthase alpha chain
MDRLQQLFRRKDNNILSIYFTAGYPQLNDTVTIIDSLDKAGADLIEIGIPFSDPMADGLTIQESNNVALQNGMSVSLLFQQLSDIRSHTQMPLLLMGYLNPILQYGFERFCKDAQQCGIDAFIIPDIPLYEYENNYRDILQKYKLQLIFLITPQTPAERISYIDELSTGFIYLVTSSSVTGKNAGFTTQHATYLKGIKDKQLKHPVLAGFGISTAEDFRLINDFVQGGIIGSKFINILKENPQTLQPAIAAFINDIKGANKQAPLQTSNSDKL